MYFDVYIKHVKCSSYLYSVMLYIVFFFFQAEDGIRDYKVTGVQTCALPIWVPRGRPRLRLVVSRRPGRRAFLQDRPGPRGARGPLGGHDAQRRRLDQRRAAPAGWRAAALPGPPARRPSHDPGPHRQSGAHPAGRGPARAPGDRPRRPRAPLGRDRGRLHQHPPDADTRRHPAEKHLRPERTQRARALPHRLGDRRVGRAGGRPDTGRPPDLLVRGTRPLAARPARGRAAPRRRGPRFPATRRDPVGEPGARVRPSAVPHPADRLAAGPTRAARRRRPGAGGAAAIDAPPSAPPRHSIPGTAEPGWTELCDVLEDVLADNGANGGPIELGRVKSRGYRPGVGADGRAHSFVLKRFDPWLARRHQAVPRRRPPAPR